MLFFIPFASYFYLREKWTLTFLNGAGRTMWPSTAHMPGVWDSHKGREQHSPPQVSRPQQWLSTEGDSGRSHPPPSGLALETGQSSASGHKSCPQFQGLSLGEGPAQLTAHNRVDSPGKGQRKISITAGVNSSSVNCSYTPAWWPVRLAEGPLELNPHDNAFEK